MRARYSVTVGGVDITPRLNPILISLRVSDRAGATSDSAQIEIDDTDGGVVMPARGARVTVALGWEDGAFGRVFEGTIDEISAQGDRGGGRTMTISAKGMDTGGKAKQGQRRHFDDATIAEALQTAGEFAGVPNVKVDPALASITRPYIALDDESFAAFGERIAREVGGTFKIVGDTAVLARRNGGATTGGAMLGAVRAEWGVNLHSYDVQPTLGRPVEKEALSRWYDFRKADWLDTKAATGTRGAVTVKPARYSEADEARAGEQTEADAKESDRRAGEGNVTIEGDITAQPEALCIIANCRPGVDGIYRIEAVDHALDRGGGFTTQLELRQPKGKAGRDSRGAAGEDDEAEDDDLPVDWREDLLE